MHELKSPCEDCPLLRGGIYSRGESAGLVKFNEQRDITMTWPEENGMAEQLYPSELFKDQYPEAAKDMDDCVEPSTVYVTRNRTSVLGRALRISDTVAVKQCPAHQAVEDIVKSKVIII